MSEPIYKQVIRDVEARAEVGKKTYGRYLMNDVNGRDPVQDAYEESIDMAKYLKQTIHERRALLEYVARLEGALREIHNNASRALAEPTTDTEELVGICTAVESALATSPLAGQPQPAPATLDRLAALERERNTLYDAMREVCKIVGGQTADGVSVEFLLNVPSEVRLTVGKLERELAEARKPCPCKVRDAAIDAAMGGE